MFTGFLKPVVDLAHRHPAAAAATAFAAATAPAFLKDENRGYLRTALVTTPLVAALGYAGPGLVSSASRTARSGLRFTRQMPFFFNRNMSVKYKDVREFIESGTVDLGVLNPALRNWVDDAAIDFFAQVDRGAPPIEHSMESAMEIFNRLMPDDGKRTLLTYAVEGARQRALSPVQLAGSQSVGPLTAMASSDLRDLVNANRANPKFVQEFSRRLRWADRLKDTGPMMSALNTSPSKLVSMNMAEGLGLLQAQRPAVAEALQAAVRKGTVESATLMAEQVSDGSIGRILGVNLKGSGGKLDIPLFDPATGTVRVGDNFQRLGVGRRIYSKQGVFDLDVFVANNLTQDWGTLKKDIGRAAYFGGIDPLNEFKMATHLESQMSVLPAHAMLLRSRSAVPTGAPLFESGRAFNDLDPLQRIGLYKQMLSGGMGQQMTRIGSEGGTSKGVFEFAESELYTVGGLPSLAKQTPFYRSFSKELQLAAGNIPSAWKPRVTTSAVQGLGGVPELRMSVAGISPQQRALFGDLPSSMADLDGYASTAISRIMKDNPSLTHAEAEAAWGRISRKMVKEPSYFAAAKRVGGLGEGGILLHNKFGAFNMEARTTTRVNQLHINPDAYKTNPFGPNQLIGFSGLEPITSTAPETFIESVASVGGQFELTMRQRYAVETGAKIDVAGVKGLAILAGEDEFSKVKELLNIYGQATGANVAIPDFVDAIAPLHYTQAKVSDPFRLMLEQAAEVTEQLSGKNKYIVPPDVLSEVNQYMFDLAAQGIHTHQDAHTRHLSFIEDSNFVQSSDRAARMKTIGDRTTEYMSRIGAFAQQRAPWAENSLFASFRSSRMSNLMDFMQHNAMVASAAFWDTTRRNVPQLTSATFDMFSEMFRGGHLEGIKDIMSRLEFQGDPSMASEFARSFVQQDFTKPMGTVIPILEAAPAGVNLGTLDARSGSIFDPARKDIQSNFSLALKEPVYARIGGRDVEVTHVPVLGKMAYGGGTNVYEKPGEGLAFGATDIEKKLADVVRSAHDPTMMSTALSKYFEEMYGTLFGKQGFYRAKGVDAMGGVSGFLQTRSTPDPFQVLLPEQMARRVRDSKIRDALLAGEEVMATVARHPIQSAPYMRVKVAPDAGLGANMIGMDERIRALFGADDDKDILNLFFYRNGSQAEREALAAINNLDSNQWKSLKTLEMLYGSAEDSRNVVSAGVKSLPQLLEEGLQSGGSVAGRATQVTQRMAGGTVGAYSNLLTRLYTNIEMHPTIGSNPEARSLLGHLFWSVRQVPISAQKGKMTLDPENPLALWQKISSGLTARNDQGVQQVYEGMREVIKGTGKRSILDTDTAKIYSEMTGKPGIAGQEVNALMDVWESEKTRNLVSDFVKNRNVQADRAAALITRQMDRIHPESLYAVGAMFKEMGAAFPYLQGLVKESRTGQAVARTLGSINDVTRAAAKEIVKGSLPTLALGFGLSAAASVLTSTLKSPQPAGVAFSKTAGNFRPEERTSVSDHVPGEPMAGSMSSVNPPRRQIVARGATRTSIVAPMRNRTDLEVRMKAQDRRDTTEMQRVISQVGGGPGVNNINVNYRNGWRTKMSKLRQRQTIREQLES